jgi:Cdc6-like AAA superfamily ATPase
MINIPGTIEGIRNISKDFKEHIGLSAALTSASNGRSTNNAYILLLGLSGSGKSASVSHTSKSFSFIPDHNRHKRKYNTSAVEVVYISQNIYYR